MSSRAYHALVSIALASIAANVGCGSNDGSGASDDARSDAGAETTDAPTDAAVDDVDAAADAHCDPTPYPAGGPITVSGRVAGYDGRPFPVSNLRVELEGREVEPAADGTFEVDDVTTPYDALVVDVASGDATLFVGLSRPDPTLDLQYSRGAWRSATVSGKVGGTFVTPDGAHSTWLWVDVGGSMRSQAILGASYGLGAEWNGVATATGSVTALGGTIDLTTHAITYTGFAQQTATFTDLKTTTVDLVLDATLTQKKIVGTVHAAAGYARDRDTLIVAAHGGDAAILQEKDVAGATTAFSFDTVAEVSEPWAVALGTSGADSNTQMTALRVDLAGDASALDVTLPNGPEAATPANETTVGSCDVVSWRAVDGAVYVVRVQDETRELDVVTASTSMSFADLKRAFASTPFGGFKGHMTWSVTSVAPVADVDAAAGADHPLSVGRWHDGGSLRDAFVGKSAGRTFTVP
jgi:hypothetical protein